MVASRGTQRTPRRSRRRRSGGSERSHERAAHGVGRSLDYFLCARGNRVRGRAWRLCHGWRRVGGLRNAAGVMALACASQVFLWAEGCREQNMRLVSVASSIAVSAFSRQCSLLIDGLFPLADCCQRMELTCVGTVVFFFLSSVDPAGSTSCGEGVNSHGVSLSHVSPGGCFFLSLEATPVSSRNARSFSFAFVCIPRRPFRLMWL